MNVLPKDQVMSGSEHCVDVFFHKWIINSMVHGIILKVTFRSMVICSVWTNSWRDYQADQQQPRILVIVC